MNNKESQVKVSEIPDHFFHPSTIQPERLQPFSSIAFTKLLKCANAAFFSLKKHTFALYYCSNFFYILIGLDSATLIGYLNENKSALPYSMFLAPTDN